MEGDKNLRSEPESELLVLRRMERGKLGESSKLDAGKKGEQKAPHHTISLRTTPHHTVQLRCLHPPTMMLAGSTAKWLSFLFLVVFSLFIFGVFSVFSPVFFLSCGYFTGIRVPSEFHLMWPAVVGYILALQLRSLLILIVCRILTPSYYMAFGQYDTR